MASSLHALVGTCGLPDSRPLCDPSLFGDPIAEQILWSPLTQKGGTNLCTHRVVIRCDEHLEFRPTSQSSMAVVAMLVAGGVFPVIGGAIGIGHGNVNSAIALIATGLVLGAAGTLIWLDLRQPRVFNLQYDFFRLSPRSSRTFEGKSSDVHALQIVSRYVTMNESQDFHCHELNLVLKNAARLNVIAHGSYGDLRDDATTLSQFLNVPVWDQAVLD